MNNYFSETPICKIWGEIICLLSNKSSNMLIDLGFRFTEIKCNIDGVFGVYSNTENNLQLFFSQQNRIFFCKLYTSSDGTEITWKNQAPDVKRVNNMLELEAQITIWLDFIKEDFS